MFIRIVFLLLLCSVQCAAQTAGLKQSHYDYNDGLSSTLIGGGVQDSRGLLWFATWNGLNCYDGYEFHSVSIEPGDNASIGTNHIRDILMSEEGNIICHTDYGIYEFDLHSYSFRDIPAEKIDSLQKLTGRRWKGLTDSQGNSWTADHTGLFKTFTPRHRAQILGGTEGEDPRAVIADSDSMLWVGTRGHNGVNVYDRSGRLVRSMSLDRPPYCLYCASDGVVWIGCKPGALLKAGGESITSDAVYDIKEDSRGRLWIATFGDGVKYCANPRDEHPVLSSSLGGGKVRKLYITPGDVLVAATNDGLLVGDINVENPENITLRRLHRDGNDSRSLCSNATLSVGGDGMGHVFICSESSGIDMIDEDRLLDENPSFTHFNKRNSSLTDDICNGMTVVSDSLIMIVGRNHIMAFNPITDRTVNFSKAFWGDSCDFAETTPVMTHDGSWIFGAKQGAFVATTQDLSGGGDVTPLVFTTLGINGGVEKFCLPPKDKVSLTAAQRNITIGFAALDYIDNEDILYRTRLDRLPWTGATRSRSVTLFDLAPGRHVLEIQSTDRYGRWVDNVRSLVLTVEPYWYETWWARTLFILAAIILTGGIIYTIIYVRRVNRHRRELLEKYMALIGGDSGDVTVEADDSVSEIEPLVPDQKPEDTAFLNRVRRYVEDNLDNPEANIDDMALASATSRSTLNRHLRSQLGITAAQLLIEARLQRAVQLLEGKSGIDCPVIDVAAQCGYTDVYYFQRVFKKKYGISPADYREARQAGKI